jgi:Zn-dependent protease with chaperone function
MKPTYLLIGLIFLLVSPAVLLYGTVVERGYEMYNPITQTQDWVKGNPLLGSLISLFSAISLWIMIPCFIYGVVASEKGGAGKRSPKARIVSLDLIPLFYALGIISLYSLCFIFNSIPPYFPTVVVPNSTTIRNDTVLVLFSLWIIALIFVRFIRSFKHEAVGEISFSLALLVSGLLSFFLGVGNSFLYQIAGSKLYADYSGAVSILLAASGGILVPCWAFAQIHRGKANRIFAILRTQSDKIPLLNFEPASVEQIDVGSERRYHLFLKRTKRLKLLFRVLLFIAAISASLIIYFNTRDLIDKFLLIPQDPLPGMLGLPAAFLAWYFFSLIPIGVVVVLIEYLRARFLRTQIPDLDTSDLEFDSLVKGMSKEMGVQPPRTVVLTDSTTILETNPMFVWKASDTYFLVASSRFIDDLRKSSDLTLEAAIAHELAHIKDRDVEDRILFQTLRESLDKAFYRISKISLPLVLLFPFSIVLLDFLPFWLIFVAFLAFFILLGKEIIPYIMFPVVISAIAGVVYFPTAMLLGKLSSMTEMCADMEACNVLGTRKPMKEMLLKLQRYEKTTSDIIADTVKPFREMIDRLAWKDYFLKTPGIIIQGVHSYGLAAYSTIPARVANLDETRIKKETIYTILGRIVFFLRKSAVDTFTNTRSRTGLIIASIWVAPTVFVVSVTSVVRNLPLSIIYTVASLVIVGKATKYVYSILDTIEKATSAKAAKSSYSRA